MDALPREPGFVSPEEVWEGLLEDATLETNWKVRMGVVRQSNEGKAAVT